MGFLLLLFFLTAPDLPFYTADATWIARYNQARRELERGAYRNSEQLGAACLAEARQAADGGNQAIVLSLLHLTELHEKYGRYRAGDSLAARALVLCERSGEERWPVLRAQLLAVQARCLIHLERYEAAGRQLDTAEALLRYYLGEDHPGMAAVYGPMGLLALERQAYPQAADYHRRALGLRRHAPEAPSATDAVLSYQLAEVFLQQHRFSAADSLLQQAEDILRQQNPQHPELAYVYNHWARVQLDRSRLFQARLYLEKAERLQVAKLGGEHLHLAKIHLNWANYYHTSDSLPQARLRLDAAEALLRRQSMEESAVQGLVLAAYSQLYYEERNTGSSLDYLQRALPLFRRRDKPQEYILSLVKQTMQRADTVQVEDEARYRKEIGAAIDTLLAAKDQWEAHGFPRDLNYAHLLERIGYLYDYYLGENHESEKWYLQARVVMEALLAGPEGSLETVNEDYVNVIKNLAILYDLSGRPEPAEQFYFEALEKDSLLFGVDHPRYIQTLNDLGAFYAFHLEDAASAERYFRRAGRGQVDLIREYYAFLDEKGRAEYLDNIYFYLSEFLRFGASYELSAAALEALQELSLMTKSLALDFGRNDRHHFSRLTDPEALALWQAWQQARRQFAGAALMSRAGRAAAGIDLEAEQQRLRALERRLLVVSNRALGQGEHPPFLSFAELQQQLPPGEAAIDIVTVDVEEEETGAVLRRYYALLTHPGRDAPAMIPLCREAELEPLVLTRIMDGGLNYAEDFAMGYQLYQLIWEPLEPWLSDIHTVHLSPTGLLHKINVGLLRYRPDDSAMLRDRLNLHYYGSLRNMLTAPVTNQADPSPTALLLGGIDYEAAATSPAAGWDGGVGGEAAPEARSMDFSYLPNTLTEIQTIGQALTKDGWSVAILSDSLAGERQLLQTLESRSPRILHLATHGFFYERDPLADRDSYERLARLEEPLLRSGLALAGGNGKHKTGTALSGTEGILTAYEVSTLPLSGTRLAVLSACETAGGDIRNAEGVFGLQRAFKLAGVDQLLISLWRVDDQSTALLMQHFYQYLLAGRPAAEALRLAQDELRKNPYYGRPFYWGAIILLE